jgi:two-component system phosphate regulon response regulator PhoB
VRPQDLSVLVVEDERDLADLVSFHLRQAGYDARVVHDGRSALAAVAAKRPDIVLLDLNLPDVSGIEICRTLRAGAATRDVPVLMLTARGAEVDRVVGFEVGADDYVIKPYSARELVLRLRALLRRSTLPPTPESDGQLRTGNLRIDMAAHRAWVDDVEVALTVTEFRLLATLLRRIGRVQTRGQLLQDVWDMPPDLDTRTVDTHLKRLREKLGAAGERIETLRGVGYRLNPLPKLADSA